MTRIRKKLCAKCVLYGRRISKLDDTNLDMYFDDAAANQAKRTSGLVGGMVVVCHCLCEHMGETLCHNSRSTSSTLSQFLASATFNIVTFRNLQPMIFYAISNIFRKASL
jgi:hypothetical protein